MALVPRVVIVTRPSAYEELLMRHGTLEQARFVLAGRGQDLDEVEAWHERFVAALDLARASIPRQWRRARIGRADLDRFLFEPEDIVVAVGQDGLVANVAKYLSGQPVIGVNPDPERLPGVLVPVPPAVAPSLIDLAGNRPDGLTVEERTMAVARLDDGQELRALNEVFIGQRTHQSARYRIRFGEHTERHSSSGLIVSTGTGATGWTASIHRQCRSRLCLPRPTERSLTFFVREAWPSPATGTDIVEGRLEGDANLEVVSEMAETGVVFADGIEDDALHFGWGQHCRVSPAERGLALVHP